MSPYFAMHAGLLRYVAKEFTESARADEKNGKRLELYASILERIVEDLSVGTRPA